MKICKIAIVFFLLLNVITSDAQKNHSTGMQFFSGSWDELLNAAKKQNKLIFIDVYTDWCGPCKAMDKFIFTAKKVGEKYNPLFLNYRLNAEKGEGIGIAKGFNVGAYPTFLFLNNQGFLVDRVVGEKEVQPFIQIADEAVAQSKDTNNIGNMQADFNAGRKDTAFLFQYLSKLTKLEMDNSTALNAYFEALPYTDLEKENRLLLLGDYIQSPRSAALVFLMDRYEGLSPYAKNKLKDHLYNVLVDKGMVTVITEKNFAAAEKLIQYVNKLGALTTSQQYHLDYISLILYSYMRNNKQIRAIGYRLTKGLMDVSKDSILREDKRRYQEIMKPYLSGQEDSTKIVGFQEEKKYVLNIYTRELCLKLSNVAESFLKLPDEEEVALKDALNWASKRVDA